MPNSDSTLESINTLLELARNFEQKGNIKGALDTYKLAFSRLEDESPLKKEIEIIIRNLEDHPGKPGFQLWKLAIAFFIGLLVMGAIVYFIRPIFTSTMPTPEKQTSIALTPGIRNTESIPESATSSLTSSPVQTSSPTTTVYLLSIKAAYVSLRAGPNIKHPEITGNYDKGTKMKILGSYADWYFVEATDGNKGWLFSGWVIVDSDSITMIPTIGTVPTAPAIATKRPYPNP